MFLKDTYSALKSFPGDKRMLNFKQFIGYQKFQDHSATLHHTAKGYFRVRSLSFCSYTRKMLQCSCVASTGAMLSQRRSLTHTALTNSC